MKFSSLLEGRFSAIYKNFACVGRGRALNFSSGSNIKRGEDQQITRHKPTSSQIEEYKNELYALIQNKRDLEGANRFSRYLTENCEPNLHLFNVILKGQLMMRNVEGIKDVLVRIAQNNFAFNAVTLNLLLVYYRDLDMMEEAEKLFEAMADRRGDSNPLINCAGPNLSAFTTMIAGWSGRGDYGRAKKYFDGIEASHLVPDERAKCSFMSAAVGPSGDLKEAKRIFESLTRPNFVAMKLWCRATFRLGGLEVALRNLLTFDSNSLELGELIKWVLIDFKENIPELTRISCILIESCVGDGVRIGDPKILHFLFDALKKDETSLTQFGDLCVKLSEALLPILGGRLLHRILESSRDRSELATAIVLQCQKLQVPLPNGLLLDYSKKYDMKPKTSVSKKNK